MDMTLEARVERGAALLDREMPGWWERIDVVRLDVREPCRCIGGQLGSGEYGRYSRLMKQLFGDSACAAVAEHGFAAADYDYEEITGLWREAVAARRVEILAAVDRVVKKASVPEHITAG